MAEPHSKTKMGNLWMPENLVVKNLCGVGKGVPSKGYKLLHSFSSANFVIGSLWTSVGICI